MEIAATEKQKKKTATEKQKKHNLFSKKSIQNNLNTYQNKTLNSGTRITSPKMSTKNCFLASKTTHSVPQGEMGLMKSTKDVVWKV